MEQQLRLREGGVLKDFQRVGVELLQLGPHPVDVGQLLAQIDRLEHPCRGHHALIAVPPALLSAKCPRLLRDDDLHGCLTARGVDRLVEPIVDQGGRDGRRVGEPAVVRRACRNLPPNIRRDDLPKRRDRRRRRRADEPMRLTHGTEQDESQSGRGYTGEESGNRCVIPGEYRADIEPHDHCPGTGGKHPGDELAPRLAVSGKIVSRGPRPVRLSGAENMG